MTITPTAAPEVFPGGSSQVESRPAPRDRKPTEKVEHLYWVADGRLAREMDVQVRALCGIWMHLDGVAELVEVRVNANGGSVTVDAKVDDCKTCVRVLRSTSARALR